MVDNSDTNNISAAFEAILLFVVHAWLPDKFKPGVLALVPFIAPNIASSFSKGVSKVADKISKKVGKPT